MDQTDFDSVFSAGAIAVLDIDRRRVTLPKSKKEKVCRVGGIASISFCFGWGIYLWLVHPEVVSKGSQNLWIIGPYAVAIVGFFVFSILGENARFARERQEMLASSDLFGVEFTKRWQLERERYFPTTIEATPEGRPLLH